MASDRPELGDAVGVVADALVEAIPDRVAAWFVKWFLVAIFAPFAVLGAIETGEFAYDTTVAVGLPSTWAALPEFFTPRVVVTLVVGFLALRVFSAWAIGAATAYVRHLDPGLVR